MKGNPQVLDALNGALTIELTAINQYFCQAKMCQNWGFLKLYHKHYHESMGEMKHAEKLIDSAGSFQYAFRVEHAGVLLVEGRAAVMTQT